jgi:HD superfamily phosphohydrolase
MKVRLRDPVHQFVTLQERQVRLLQTTALQRLRGIRQLALASLVYPGAVHTRFDHTLGVMHVAGLMGRVLGLDQDELELVELAALLHDIGHGPFSHVSEYALDRYADRSALDEEQRQEKIHEVITAHMIRNDSQIVDFLGKETCENIVRLLGCGHGQPALRAIVSGPLDADKQDYLLRDSYFCGVPYGVFDIHQFHRSLVMVGEADEKQVMIDPSGIHAVEQFALAKYYLTKSVYRHRVRLITDQMIVRAITLGVERDKIQELKRLYRFDNSDRFVKNYETWDDARFLGAFGSNSKTRCGRMLQRLIKRQLLKQVFVVDLRDLRKDLRETAGRLSRPESDSIRRKVEKDVADYLGKMTNQTIDPDFVICHSFNIKSVRESSRNDEAPILVNAKRRPRQFEVESALFGSINQKKGDEFFVQMYAPVEWKTDTQKKRVKRECEKRIKEIIETACESSKDGGIQ